MTGARDPLGQEWPMRRGLLNLVASRRRAGWLIDVLHNMELAQLSPAVQASLAKLADGS